MRSMLAAVATCFLYLYTSLYVYKAPRLFMSGKLYWRIKKDGKWTWTPATVSVAENGYHVVIDLEEELSTWYMQQLFKPGEEE